MGVSEESGDFTLLVCSAMVSSRFSSEAFTFNVEYCSIVKDPVQGAQQGVILIEVGSPVRRMLVAGKDNVETIFFVVSPDNQVKEQPGILLVEFTLTNLVNSKKDGQTRPLRMGTSFPARQAAVNLSRSSDIIMK